MKLGSSPLWGNGIIDYSGGGYSKLWTRVHYTLVTVMLILDITSINDF